MAVSIWIIAAAREKEALAVLLGYPSQRTEHSFNKIVEEDVISSVTSFFVLYLVIFILSVFVILAVEDISIIGAISACASSIGNVGPGFGEVGATHDYMFLSSFSKLWLCMLMILGRLELFTVIVIFSPMFWRK